MQSTASSRPAHVTLRRVASHWREAIALLLFVTAAAFVASTYFGHSTSPYGTCYSQSGRAVPCEALKH